MALSYQVSLDGAGANTSVGDLKDAIQQAHSAVDSGRSRRAKVHELDNGSRRLVYELEASGAPLEEVQEQPLPETSQPGPLSRPSGLAERFKNVVGRLHG